MLSLVLNNWKPIAIALLVVTLYGYGYLNGMESVQREWEKARLTQLEVNIRINSEVSNDYQKRIAAIRKRYDAFKLRETGRMPVPNPAFRPDAATITNEFSRGMGEVTTLMLEADLQTQQLISLQEWINNVSK